MHTATDFGSVYKLKASAALWRRLFCFRHVQELNQYWSGGWPKITPTHLGNFGSNIPRQIHALTWTTRDVSVCDRWLEQILDTGKEYLFLTVN